MLTGEQRHAVPQLLISSMMIPSTSRRRTWSIAGVAFDHPAASFGRDLEGWREWWPTTTAPKSRATPRGLSLA